MPGKCWYCNSSTVLSLVSKDTERKSFGKNRRAIASNHERGYPPLDWKCPSKGQRTKMSEIKKKEKKEGPLLHRAKSMRAGED